MKSINWADTGLPRSDWQVVKLFGSTHCHMTPAFEPWINHLQGVRIIRSHLRSTYMEWFKYVWIDIKLPSKWCNRPKWRFYTTSSSEMTLWNYCNVRIDYKIQYIRNVKGQQRCQSIWDDVAEPTKGFNVVKPAALQIWKPAMTLTKDRVRQIDSAICWKRHHSTTGSCQKSHWTNVEATAISKNYCITPTNRRLQWQ